MTNWIILDYIIKKYDLLLIFFYERNHIAFLNRIKRIKKLIWIKKYKEFLIIVKTNGINNKSYKRIN